MNQLKPRQLDIMQSLAKMLGEKGPVKITTALLANECGITEAAIYRHFPSKKKIYSGLVDFCEKNPGLARLLTREAFSVDETSLDQRIGQMMSKVELLIKQNLQKHEQETKNKLGLPTATAANLLLACSEGIIQQFVRSGFQDSPSKRISDQFEFLVSSLDAN